MIPTVKNKIGFKYDNMNGNIIKITIRKTYYLKKIQQVQHKIRIILIIITLPMLAVCRCFVSRFCNNIHELLVRLHHQFINVRQSLATTIPADTMDTCCVD